MRDIDLAAEREFQNQKEVGDHARAPLSKYYWSVALEREKHLQKTRERIKGKHILEIGCASGVNAALYAPYAKSYVGADISDKSIEKAKARNLDNAEFICCDGHKIPKADGEFDYVIVDALLHHLDIKIAFKEIKRLLKKDGVLIFNEPLGTNFAFNLYRTMTPSARTVDERPFTFSDLNLMKEHFAFEEIRWFGFTNILSAFSRNEFLRSNLTKFDNGLRKTPIKYLYWQFAGFARNK